MRTQDAEKLYDVLEQNFSMPEVGTEVIRDLKQAETGRFYNPTNIGVYKTEFVKRYGIKGEQVRITTSLDIVAVLSNNRVNERVPDLNRTLKRLFMPRLEKGILSDKEVAAIVGESQEPYSLVARFRKEREFWDVYRKEQGPISAWITDDDDEESQIESWNKSIPNIIIFGEEKNLALQRWSEENIRYSRGEVIPFKISQKDYEECARNRSSGGERIAFCHGPFFEFSF